MDKNTSITKHGGGTMLMLNSNNVNEKWKIIICLHEIGITCLSILCLIHKVMVRESISKMKTGNSRGPSDVLPEVVKSI